MSTTPARTTPTGARRRPRPSARRFAPLAVAIAAVIGLVAAPAAGAAEAPVGLGVATSFAILAGAGITNTGATTITGDVGSYATTSITGFDTVVQTGVNHGGDAVTQQGKLDLVDAYNDAAGRGPVTAVTPVDLAGELLVPGVYSTGTIELSGTLTLDAQGDPDAVWVFQAASTLITGSNSVVNVINGAPNAACNVFWKVGSSATLGTDSSFVGTILASESITLDPGAEIEGRLLAQTGEVTLINNTITNVGCDALAATPGTPPGTDTDTGTDTGTDGSGTDGSGTGSATPSGDTPTGTGGTPTTDLTTTLAFTGTDGRFVVVGVLSVLLGLGCVALSSSRLRVDPSR